MSVLIGLIGIMLFMAVLVIFSSDYRKINQRTVIVGLLLQFGLGILLIKVPSINNLVERFSKAVAHFLDYGLEGSKFLFANLANKGFTSTLEVKNTAGDVTGSTLIHYWNTFGFQFAILVLPTIIFFSAFIFILYYFGIIQFVVENLSKVIRKLMGTTAVETLCCTANIFIGQTEAPLLIKPYLSNMTKSEISAIMTCGFATVAGGVMAGYIAMGIPTKHLIVASVMAAPASLMVAKILFPETEKINDQNEVHSHMEKSANILEAISDGTSNGLKLALNVGAMLIAFVSLIAVLNSFLGWIGSLTGIEALADLSLNKIFGWILTPVTFLMGVPSSEIEVVGGLIGTKIAINEFVAFSDLGNLIHTGQLSQKSIAITSYALCGFANFASIGIQIGGITPMAPNKKHIIASAALKAMLGGAMVSIISGTIAGILYSF